jgi:hypothetical protein
LPQEDKPQFPHPDYIGHLHSIKTEAEAKPSSMLYRYAKCVNKSSVAPVLAGVGATVTAYAAMRYKNVI